MRKQKKKKEQNPVLLWPEITPAAHARHEALIAPMTELVRSASELDVDIRAVLQEALFRERELPKRSDDFRAEYRAAIAALARR